MQKSLNRFKTVADRLLNKVAVVTHADNPISHAVAEKFLEEGAKVVSFAATTTSSQDQLTNSFPARSLNVTGQMTVAADRSQLADSTTRRFGNIDVLIIVTEKTQRIPFIECTNEFLTEKLTRNFSAPFQTVRSLFPMMNAGASIIFVTGTLTQQVTPRFAADNAINAALVSLTKTLSAELAPQKIRVNSIAVDSTDRSNSINEIAETALFLASDASQKILGQQFVVDEDHSGC